MHNKSDISLPILHNTTKKIHSAVNITDAKNKPLYCLLGIIMLSPIFFGLFLSTNLDIKRVPHSAIFISGSKEFPSQ